VTSAGRGWRDEAAGARLAGLRVLMIGVEPLISRDVARALKAEQALVTAAAREERVLARLQRDLGLYRTTVDAAAIDLASASEMRLFAMNLQGQGALPHLLICCCPDIACPLPLAQSALQPSLVLHVLPPARSWLGRLARWLQVPPLAALFEARRRVALFDADARPGRVRIAGHVFSLRRGEEAAPLRRGRPLVGGERRPKGGSTEPTIPYSSPQGRFHQEVS
jgi:hypothetical protein